MVWSGLDGVPRAVPVPEVLLPGPGELSADRTGILPTPGLARAAPRAALKICEVNSRTEVRQEFSVVLTARAVGGQPTPSSESSEVRWVPAAELPGYTMDRSMRIRSGDFLTRGKPPVVI